jgi:hypothetical protein
VSDAVFNNEYDVVSSAYDGNTSPSIKAQNRWVEVISAEPPVRRSDFMHSFNSSQDTKTTLALS